MNVLLRPPLTVDEYLAWADAQPERQRTELINGQIVAMPAERAAHTRVNGAAYLALVEAVKTAGLGCEVMTDGMAVRIDDHTAYEPDALVYCGTKLPLNAVLVPNPVVILEVLSPSSIHSDTSAKLIGYFKLPSVAHYLVLDPEAREVTHYTRDGLPNLLRTGMLQLQPPGFQLQVEQLFGGAP